MRLFRVEIRNWFFEFGQKFNDPELNGCLVYLASFAVFVDAGLQERHRIGGCY